MTLGPSDGPNAMDGAVLHLFDFEDPNEAYAAVADVLDRWGSMTDAEKSALRQQALHQLQEDDFMEVEWLPPLD